MGKTNVLDAIYYLSMCKSATGMSDQHNIRHDAEMMMLKGLYENTVGETEEIVCGVRRGGRKTFKRNDKPYRRFSEHVGLIPLVMISPSDSALITGASEERRRFMDVVISQHDPVYLEALIRYQKTVQQRNALLRQEEDFDVSLCAVLEELMDSDSRVIYSARRKMLAAFVPVFQKLYASLCPHACETVEIQLQTHAERGDLLPLLVSGRERERIVGYTLYGPQKDELELLLGGFNVRREGSQGQQKTYLIAMRLAQYLYLKSKSNRQAPILLLDDIFDKLDAARVAAIVDYVSGDAFQQIFITDTNRDHLDKLLEATDSDYRLFHVKEGVITD